MSNQSKILDFSTFWKVMGKTIFFILILLLCFIVGLFIGYVFLGHGSFWDVLNLNTWGHIMDFIR